MVLSFEDALRESRRPFSRDIAFDSAGEGKWLRQQFEFTFPFNVGLVFVVAHGAHEETFRTLPEAVARYNEL